jgi:FAD:protein FMN transferase
MKSTSSDGGVPESAHHVVARDLRAMNTDVGLVATGAHAERRLARAARWLPAFERRFSRFLPDSELSQLNAAAGTPFRASPSLFRLVRLALEFARRSDGIFDPTIVRSLEALGYNRSFELVPDDCDARAHAPTTTTWRDVRLDALQNTVTLPERAGVDLGGIGKGIAVDRVAAMLGSPALVNCGGDVFAAGRPPGEVGWRVGVSDPFAPDADILVLTVEDRAVATSSTMRRNWNAGGRRMHHLIDPRSGQPSTSDAVQVTVVAPTAVEADVYAKVALLRGADQGMQFLGTLASVEGLAVRHDGAVFQSANFGEYWSG